VPPRARGARWIFVALLLSLHAVPRASAADAPPPGAGDRLDWDYLKGFGSDAEDLATAPTRWDATDWLEAGGVVGVGVGLYFGVDVAAHDAVRRNPSAAATRSADAGQAFGNGLYVVPGLALAYLGGEAGHDAKLRRAALDAAESLAFASLETEAIKSLAGRDRPYVNGDHAVWNGPSTANSKASFPSGHSAAAFSIATIFASEYGDHAFAAPLAYGLATVTALSRVEQNQHWASDVFAGSALGYFTAKSILASRRKSGGRLTFVPWLDDRATGARVVYRF